MKARRILSAIMVFAMIATFAVNVSAADGVTLPDGVTADSFGENTVTDGVNYYATMTAALAGVHGTDNAVLYCKPEANVGTMTHGHVCKNLTVYGNGAYLSGGEQDFEIDSPAASGSSCTGLTDDVTLSVYNLTGAGAWGTKSSEYTINIQFTGCENMGKIFFNGTAGELNLAITDCSFLGDNVSSCKVYSNTYGTITLDGVDFSGVAQPVALNNKSTGTQTITLKNCTFTDCGASTNDWTVPVSVKSSVEGGTSLLTVEGCSFSGTVTNSVGQNADIILDYGVGTTTANISSTSANVLVETEANVGTAVTVSATETRSFSNVETTTPVAKIGDVEYTDLQEAIDAAADGAEIDIVADFSLTAQEFTYLNYTRLGYAGVIIPDGKTIAIDLLGHSITYSDAYGDFDNAMIVNIGDLTINDSVGGGAIVYNSNDNDLATKTYTYLHPTILNGGKLTLNDGITVKNTAPADTDCTNAIDNHSHFSYSYENDAVCIINDANIETNKYYAIRQYTHYLTGYENDVIINNGTVTGIYMQQGDSWYYTSEAVGRLAKASLTINGGTIKTLQAAEDYTCYAVRTRANPDNPNWKIAITGGTVEDVVVQIQKGYRYSEDGTASSGTLLSAEVTGSRTAEWLEANGGFITGGTFVNIGSADDVTSDVSSFLADGYALTENSDGTCTVEKEAPDVVDPAFGTNNGVIKLDATETDYEVVILATIDSLNYRNVGLEVLFNGQTVNKVLDTVYEAVKAKTSEDSEATEIAPSAFGGDGKFIFLSKVTFGITHTSTEEFSFRPFATKLDGTVIYGKTTIDTIGK